MKKQLILLAIISSFMACQPEGRVFIEHQDLSPEVEWLKKDKRTFKVAIEDAVQVYNFMLTFRYANGYQY
ncbi:MAG: hypothetical protein CVT95_05950 [Bacteroidetes bacterium HGW-Bacteroidetes-12]|nr:MAG: hypothetical protein CVT95_05950 [Bacteroidetes bacterium HGW-Bacteroidetes-12]